jgi:hypothetical protein
MKPDEMFDASSSGPPPTLEQVRLLWPQARGELMGYARALERSGAGITAAQLRMALAMADAYAQAQRGS